MTLTQISVALGILGTVVGGTFVVEDRYAHNTELQLVASRVNQYILRDERADLRRELWAIQDRHGQNCGPLRQRCRIIVDRLNEIDEQLKRTK